MWWGARVKFVRKLRRDGQGGKEIVVEIAKLLFTEKYLLGGVIELGMIRMAVFSIFFIAMRFIWMCIGRQ
jgi:hypothetical protein